MSDFDRMHILLQWGGLLPGNEEWSCSLRLANSNTGDDSTGMPSAGELQSWLDGSLKDAVVAYHTRGTTFISGAAKLSFVKANIIKMDGHYLDAITHEHVVADIAGGGSGPPPPNQIAWVVSLTTGLSRGPAHRGRYYLPLPTVDTDTATGLVNPINANALCASTKTFLEAVSDTPGIDGPANTNVCVMSRKSGAPATHKVTGVEVGLVLDTQRRRRRSLPETYASTAVDFGVF